MSEKRFEVLEAGFYATYLVIRDHNSGLNISGNDGCPLEFCDRKKVDTITSLLNYCVKDYQGKISKLEQRIEYLENKLGVGIE